VRFFARFAFQDFLRRRQTDKQRTVYPKDQQYTQLRAASIDLVTPCVRVVCGATYSFLTVLLPSLFLRVPCVLCGEKWLLPAQQPHQHR
jgi:hypothetical protein